MRACDILYKYSFLSAFHTTTNTYFGMQDTYKATFVDQSVSCASETTSKSAYIKAYAVLDVDISVSAGVTFIVQTRCQCGAHIC